ncbi:hypothetical protein Lser_V15G00906 [Lactuca serriola]
MLRDRGYHISNSEIEFTLQQFQDLHGQAVDVDRLRINASHVSEPDNKCVALLGKFIPVREPNIRYLGLENMTRMMMVTDVQDIIKRHQDQIITSLKDPDISMQRRALDLLYGMCDVSNAKDIVEELLQYLGTTDFTMCEELTLKAAILADKFAPDLLWYGDVIHQLIDKAGNFVSDDI